MSYDSLVETAAQENTYVFGIRNLIDIKSWKTLFLAKKTI